MQKETPEGERQTRFFAGFFHDARMMNEDVDEDEGVGEGVDEEMALTT